VALRGGSARSIDQPSKLIAEDNKAAGIGIMAWIVLSCPATKVCWNASSGWMGLLALKLKYAPGMEPLNLPWGAYRPGEDKALIGQGRDGWLPAPEVPRVQVAAAPAGGRGYDYCGSRGVSSPAAVREMTLSSKRRSCWRGC